MKKRWAFFLSLALAVSAFAMQWRSADNDLEARKQQTNDFMHGLEAKNFPAGTLHQKSKLLSFLAMPVAAIGAFCLFLSRRRTEPVWRLRPFVGLLLLLYLYVVLGPI
jgi:hypothetical protein